VNHFFVIGELFSVFLNLQFVDFIDYLKNRELSELRKAKINTYEGKSCFRVLVFSYI